MRPKQAIRTIHRDALGGVAYSTMHDFADAVRAEVVRLSAYQAAAPGQPAVAFSAAFAAGVLHGMPTESSPIFDKAIATLWNEHADARVWDEYAKDRLAEPEWRDVRDPTRIVGLDAHVLSVDKTEDADAVITLLHRESGRRIRIGPLTDCALYIEERISGGGDCTKPSPSEPKWLEVVDTRGLPGRGQVIAHIQGTGGVVGEVRLDGLHGTAPLRIRPVVRDDGTSAPRLALCIEEPASDGGDTD